MTRHVLSGQIVGNRMPAKLEDGVETERVQIVAPRTWVDRVEEWRRRQPRIPNRSEAIRILVGQALGVDEGDKGNLR